MGIRLADLSVWDSARSHILDSGMLGLERNSKLQQPPVEAGVVATPRSTTRKPSENSGSLPLA